MSDWLWNCNKKHAAWHYCIFKLFLHKQKGFRSKLANVRDVYRKIVKKCGGGHGGGGGDKIHGNGNGNKTYLWKMCSPGGGVEKKTAQQSALWCAWRGHLIISCVLKINKWIEIKRWKVDWNLYFVMFSNLYSWFLSAISSIERQPTNYNLSIFFETIECFGDFKTLVFVLFGRFNLIFLKSWMLWLISKRLIFVWKI